MHNNAGCNYQLARLLELGTLVDVLIRSVGCGREACPKTLSPEYRSSQAGFEGAPERQ